MAVAEEADVWQVAGREIAVSRPEARYWPADGITKGDLLSYYEEMAPVMLPYFAERPVTVRVCPRGVRGPCFYRRELPKSAPDWLRGVPYLPESTGEEIQLPVIDDAAGLVWFANIGAIEFHLWATTLADLATPDQLVFDLDPGEAVEFGEVLRAAILLRETLNELGLDGLAKTSGGAGLHVFVPITPGPTFEEVRPWVKQVAERLADAHPDLIAVARGGTHKGDHVTIDYAQNSVGRNTAAPYTVRAVPGAQVSTPLSWEEVATGAIHPSDLTLRIVPERVQTLGDLFAPLLKSGQRLPKL
jgi:bifunctional non-homologous end joining protein LigD